MKEETDENLQQVTTQKSRSEKLFLFCRIIVSIKLLFTVIRKLADSYQHLFSKNQNFNNKFAVFDHVKVHGVRQLPSYTSGLSSNVHTREPPLFGPATPHNDHNVVSPWVSIGRFMTFLKRMIIYMNAHI